MIKRILPAALLPLLFLLAAPSLAIARPVEFCGNGSCQTIAIINRSSATVTRVKFRQFSEQSWNTACPKLNKSRKKNMGMNDKFKVKLKTVCSYRITFKTTKGCTGNKVAYLTPDKMRDGYYAVALRRGCDDLKAMVFQSVSASQRRPGKN